MDGRVVVITGASAGVGRAVARAYGSRGAKVALLARGGEGLKAAAQDVRERGGTAFPLEADVAVEDEINGAAKRIESELGSIDIWVNGAFAAVFAPVRDMQPEEFRRVHEVTYLGYVYGTLAALRHMRPRDAGTIVQVGSALAYRGIPLQSAYCAAKHAIQGFHESLRCELLHERSGIRTTMVQLPAVNTPQFSWGLSRLPRHPSPLPPIYQPEVAADAIVFAGDHPNRREYWVGGSTVGTLLANALAPGLLDRYLGRTGYDAQQTDLVSEARPPTGNLWEPADDMGERDYGAHGVFGPTSRRHSTQLGASKHHGLLAAGAAIVGAAGLALSMRTRRAGLEIPSHPR